MKTSILLITVAVVILMNSSFADAYNIMQRQSISVAAAKSSIGSKEFQWAENLIQKNFPGFKKNCSWRANIEGYHVVYLEKCEKTICFGLEKEGFTLTWEGELIYWKDGRKIKLQD